MKQKTAAEKILLQTVLQDGKYSSVHKYGRLCGHTILTMPTYMRRKDLKDQHKSSNYVGIIGLRVNIHILFKTFSDATLFL